MVKCGELGLTLRCSLSILRCSAGVTLIVFGWAVVAAERFVMAKALGAKRRDATGALLFSVRASSLVVGVIRLSDIVREWWRGRGDVIESTMPLLLLLSSPSLPSPPSSSRLATHFWITNVRGGPPAAPGSGPVWPATGSARHVMWWGIPVPESRPASPHDSCTVGSCFHAGYSGKKSQEHLLKATERSRQRRATRSTNGPLKRTDRKSGRKCEVNQRPVVPIFVSVSDCFKFAMSSSSSTSLLASPVTLPCGRQVPNRLVKAPMEELQAPLGGGPPPERLLHLYKAWADGHWGMIITGNIAIDETHLGTPFDVNFKSSISSQDMDQYRAYARACKSSSDGSHRPLAIVQLVHAGRQSGRGFGRAPWKPALAPSAVPMATAKGSLPWPIADAFDWALWGQCRAMTTTEVQQLIQRFIDGAEICHQAGFDGVELHASHGYQLAAFLSPRTNQRTDQYGGSAENRFRIIAEIVAGIRQRIADRQFVVGIKLNSADYVHGGLTEEDALQNIRWLAEMGTVDFAEISGGNYENPSFMMHNFNADDEMAKLGAPQTKPVVKESTRNREAFFASFAKRAKHVLPAQPVQGSKAIMALVLTGGLRSRSGCVNAIESAGVDLCGMARASALDPALPRGFMDPSIPDNTVDSQGRLGKSTVVPTPRAAEQPPGVLSYLPLKLMGAGWTTLYHALQMARIISGHGPDPQAGSWKLIKGMAGGGAR